jgi:hypothetical protein
MCTSDHEQSFGTVTDLFSSSPDDNEEAEKEKCAFLLLLLLLVIFSNILTARKTKINGPLRQQLSSSFPSVR